MNPQGGGAGLGNYGAAAGIGHGMLNMSMLQSLEQMMGGQSEGGLSMMMGGVHDQVSTGAGMTVAGAVSSISGDIGRPDSNSMIRGVGAGSNGDTGSSVGLRVQHAAGGAGAGGGTPSRYESQKRRDWNTFGQYLKNHRPPLALARCSGAHVLEFLRYLDQFGKTKVHAVGCPFFGHPQPPAPCACPLRQAWGSLDALIGRLRAAYEEHGGKPESNPFGARAVRLYLREVRETQAKARGIAYEKKKRKRPPPPPPPGSSSSLAIPGAGPCPPTTHDHSKFQPPHPAPPPGAPPAAAPSSSTEHQSLLSGSSSLLIPSFN